MQTATKNDDRGQESEATEAKVPTPPIGLKAATQLLKWLEKHSGKEE